jgi:hypothetical protein
LPEGEDSMDHARRAPAHLWIVGILAVIWNGFGGFDYLMTQTRNEAYLANFTDPQRIYFDSFPAWMEAAWALGVWGGFLGALLLLLRRRWAVAAFAVSLAGLVVTTLYQYVLSSPPEDLMTGGLMVFQIVIWIVAIALLVYAMSMRRAGVLR